MCRVNCAINRETTSEPGFIYLSTTDPWPTDAAKAAERLPDDWMEERQGARRVRRERAERTCQSLSV